MKRYEIVIWKWQEELHRAKYDFASRVHADNFTLGLFYGAKLFGKEPTGYQTVEVEKEDISSDK
jgi:hypothetical protein